MPSSKIFQTLRVLSQRELGKFRQFLESPYFNVNEELLQFGCALIEAARAGEESEVRSIKSNYKDSISRKHLTYLNNRLFRLLETFLSVEEFVADRVELNLSLLKSYRGRSLERNFDNTAKKTAVSLDRMGHQGAQYMEYRYRFQAELNRFLQGQKRRSIEPNLQAASDALIQHFILNLLHYSTQMLNHNLVVNTDFQMPLLQIIKAHLDQGNFLDSEAVRLNYQVLKMLDEPQNHEHFHALERDLPEAIQFLSRSEARNLYVHCINYCIRKTIKGEAQYLRNLLELYKALLKSNLAFENDYLSPWMYKNIISCALRLGESEWAQEFATSYQKKLHPSHRENAFRFNMARLSFHHSQYQEVIVWLQRVEYNDIFYNLDSKALLIKTYYLLKEDEALESLLRSFSLFLRRKTDLPANHKANYQNLVRIVRKLVKARKGQISAPKLSEELNMTPQISDRKWLNAQISALADRPLKP